MVNSLAIHSPGIAQTMMIITYALAAVVCFLVIVFSILSIKLLKKRLGERVEKLRSGVPLFILAALPIAPIIASVILIAEAVVLIFAIVWTIIEIKKPTDKPPVAKPKPEP